MTDYSDNQVESVLGHIGMRIGGDAPNDVIVFCPYHHNVRTPAAEVSKETGVFYCFACKRSVDLVDLVMFVSGAPIHTAKRLIAKYSGESSIVDVVNAKLADSVAYEPYDPKVISRLHNGLAASTRAQDYLRGRGLTDQSMEEYTLGYSSNLDMVIFPYYSPEGSFVVGFQGRSIDGKEFKNSTGTKKSQTLFGINLHKWDREVFCTESPIDSILLHQQGIPAVSTMGANPSNKQISLLTRVFATVYVVADNDDAGRSSAFKTCQKLDGRGIMVTPPNGNKDIGEMQYREIADWAASKKNPIGKLG